MMKMFKSLGDACEQLYAKVVQRGAYKDEMNKIIHVAKLKSTMSDNKFYRFEMKSGIWVDEISEFGMKTLAGAWVFDQCGSDVNDFYNFLTDNNLTYDDIISVTENDEVIHKHIRVDAYLQTLPEK